jgi:P-type E1-E2 ATPase
MVVTFGIVLLFTSIKEGVEDYQRHKKDKKANERQYLCFDQDSNHFIPKSSKKIHVGDYIKVLKDQEFPSDICLLKSSSSSGVCFIDTVNLDGESNLKDKKCNLNLLKLSKKQLQDLDAVLICDKPNDNLESWEGYIQLMETGNKIILEYI